MPPYPMPRLRNIPPGLGPDAKKAKAKCMLCKKDNIADISDHFTRVCFFCSSFLHIELKYVGLIEINN